MIGSVRTAGRLAALGALALLTAACVAGCGGNEPLDPQKTGLTERGKLERIVGDVPAAVEELVQGRPARFDARFVKDAGPKPQEREKYCPPMKFRLGDDPEISGDTATLDVIVAKEDPQTEQVTDQGHVQWTAVKDGDSWLLKDVPLQ